MLVITAEESPRANQVTLRISGLHCDGCALNVERALRRAPGVAEATVDFETAQGRVLYDPDATDPRRIASLPVFQEDSSFRAEVLEEGEA